MADQTTSSNTTSGSSAIDRVPESENRNTDGDSGGTATDGTTRADGDKKRLKQGILRLDISKPRRSSGGSVEFRTQPELIGETSPAVPAATSPPQLSVTWASQCDINEPDSNSKQMQNLLKQPQDRGRRPPEERANELSPDITSPTNVSDEVNSEEEDYSLSVNAIMQRRASIRGHRRKSHRGSRRTSSPMDHVFEAGSHLGDRRRSSVYTTSSGDTAISLDDGTNQDSTQEQIFENIRLHKEVIQSVKYQPWPIRRKLKLVRQAKTYVARHEGALQERFSKSRSTKDLWARFKIVMAARWKHWKREMASFFTVLIPWELRIKEIESHFGSGVASYFTFLRWLLWVNIMIAIPIVSFVIIPELLATDPTIADNRKQMTPGELKIAGNIVTIWEFEGYLKYSPLFYGFYSNISGAIRWGYNLPLAYFLTSVAVYIYSFVATLRKMAENSRMSKLSSKDDECIFSWKLFTGWDFMIGHAETAHNRIASVVVGFKEALLEEAEKKKDKRNWRIILQRILVNIVVTALLAASGYTVYIAVDRQEDALPNDNWFRRNEVNIIMTLLSFFLPMMFDALGLFENWHPRQQLRLQLARIMILNLLNLYSLMFSFIYKITGKDKDLQHLRVVFNTALEQKESLRQIISHFREKNLQNLTTTVMNTVDWTTTEISSITDNITNTITTMLPTMSGYSTTMQSTTLEVFNQTHCYEVKHCSKPAKSNGNNTMATTFILLNLTTTMLPYFPTRPPLPNTTISTLGTTPTTTVLTTPTTTTETTTITTTTTELTTTTTTESTTEPPTTTTTTVPNYEELDPRKMNDSDDYFQYYDYFDNMEGDDSLEENNDIKNRRRRDIYSLGEVFQNMFESGTKKDERLGVSTVNSNNDEDTTTTIETTTTNDQPHNLTDSYNSTPTDYDEAIAIDEFDVEDQINLTDLYHYTTLSSLSENSTFSFENEIKNVQMDRKGYLRDKLQEYVSNITSIPDYDGHIDGTNHGDNFNPDETLLYMDYDTDTENCTIEIICGPIDEFFSTQNPMDGTGMQIPRKILRPGTLEYYEDVYKNVSRTLLIIRKNLTSMCWETSLGQELVKVIVFDTIMSIAAPLCIDFFRALFVRYMNDHWCWDMEKTFPQYGDFKIAESILNLVYNQGQVWMGIFFSPGLVIINLVKLIILMYLRSWIVLTCNVPHEIVFKASKSNNFYLTLLLTMLFLCVLPVGYAIVWLRPSWHCGPFSDYSRISEFFTNTTRNALPEQLHKPLEYMTSSSTVIPLLLLLILIIYYLVSLTGALREANQDLRTQLQKERMEERRKIFKVPEEKPPENAVAAITSRWRKVLDAASPVTPTGQEVPLDPEEVKNLARKQLLSRIMKKALRKGSATSDDESLPMHEDDETDNEHHESLPHDEDGKKRQRSKFPGLHGPKRARKPSIIDIVALAKKEGTIDGHPKNRFKINRNVVDAPATSTPAAENDPDDNTRIVSERRKSLLRRQQKFGDSDNQANGQTNDSNANYELVNEKNLETEKKGKQKSEPSVFKFDLKNLKSTPKPQTPQAKLLAHLLSKQQQQPAATQPPPPSVISQSNTANVATPATAEKSHSPGFSGAVGAGGEKLAAISRTGRKRIGSFLELLKEAAKKKQEGGLSDDSQCGTPESPSAPPSILSTLPEKQKIEETTVVPSVQKKIPKQECTQPPKRQDSQTSIPVITISKTGSDECITECIDKDTTDDNK